MTEITRPPVEFESIGGAVLHQADRTLDDALIKLNKGNESKADKLLKKTDVLLGLIDGD